MWRGGATCGAQVYQWRAAVREGRLTEPATAVVGFVPIEVAGIPDAAVDAGKPVEIGLAGGRSHALMPRCSTFLEVRCPKADPARACLGTAPSLGCARSGPGVAAANLL
jgi:hypothetical protein